MIDPQGSVLADAASWLQAALMGTVATTIAVVAVAFVGLRLLSGDTSIRHGLRVVLGCFVLLGAPVIASGLQSMATRPEVPSETIAVSTPLPEVPTPPYDPYSGASVFQDWRGMQPDPFAPRPSR